MKKGLIAAAAVLAGLVGFLYYPRADKKHLVMAEAYQMGPVPPEITAVGAKQDFIATHLEHKDSAMPGYDDVLLYEESGFALATAMDSYIWKVDLATGEAQRLAEVPLVASGAVKVPGDPDRIYVCVSHLYGETPKPSARVGVYEVRLSTRSVRPVLTQVPNVQPAAPRPGQTGIVYADGTAPKGFVRDFNAENSRPFAFCNDLAVSRDGKRIYMTNPYSYEGAAMGGGAFGEAITLARNGILWRYDMDKGSVELVARDFNFIDGILLEGSDTSGEDSVLITETTKFRLDRFYLRGPRAGSYDILWDSLPGAPDGLDRDAKGNIWIGLIKKRTGFLTWAHKNPWIKYALLNLPQWLLPVPKQTGVLVLSPDASKPLFFTEHDGRSIGEIAAVIPGRTRLYLANFRTTSRGLFSIPYPSALEAAK